MSNLSSNTDLVNFDFGNLDVVPFVQDSIDEISSHPLVQSWFDNTFHTKQRQRSSKITDSREKQIRDRIYWLEKPFHHTREEHFNKYTDPEIKQLKKELQREINKRLKRKDWDKQDFKEKFNTELDDLEDEVKDAYETEEIADTWNKINKYGFTWGGFAKFLLKIRWILNLVFFAAPWICIGIWGELWNLYFNIQWNKLWAGGNWYLMANTLFLIYQTAVSVPLVVEFPPWMRHMGFIRFWSVVNAYIYNFVYFGFVIAFLLETYEESDAAYESIGTFDILMDFFFMYNTILHSANAVINTGIIIKEDQLEWFELFTSAGGKGSDYQMTWEFAKKSAYDDVWFLDPIRWFGRLIGIKDL